MNCKNCDQIAGGNFCAHCGQSTKVDKINLPNFLSELSGSIFQINRGLFFTLKALFVRPGHSIRAYLSGKRKNHFKPLAYVFTLSTIYFLLSQVVDGGTFVNDAVEGYSNGPNGPEIADNQLAILKWFAKNYAYTVLLLVPIFSLASYLAFFRAGFNYLEHFILNAYITGQQAIFYSISLILGLVTDKDDFLATITLFISIAYAFFVFWQFFPKQRRVSIILRSILTYVVYLIVLLGAVFVIFFALR